MRDHINPGPLAALAGRIGQDGRLPDDIDTTDLVAVVLARSTPAGVYLTPGARGDLPKDHPAHRAMDRLTWDWGRDTFPLAEVSQPTPQDLRTCPHYWTSGPGRAQAERTPCGHAGGHRLTDHCPACEASNRAPQTPPVPQPGH